MISGQTDAAPIAVGPPRAIVRSVADDAARLFGHRPEEILGMRQGQSLLSARFAVAWVARKTSSLSLQQIGRAMSDREHTSIIYAVRRAEQLRSEDRGYRALTDRLLALAVDRMANLPAAITPTRGRSTSSDGLRGYGLTPAEAEVMELYDTGLSPNEVAAQLRIPHARAVDVIDTYRVRPERDDARRARDAAQGSAALLAAIQQTGRTFA